MEHRILFVDDEELIVTMAAAYLTRIGYDVATAATAKSAIAQYKSEPAELVVTDLMMEPDDGITLYHEIKALNPEAKVLFMSGLGENEMVQPFVSAGQASFLSKPFGIRELKEAVEKALESAR